MNSAYMKYLASKAREIENDALAAEMTYLLTGDKKYRTLAVQFYGELKATEEILIELVIIAVLEYLFGPNF